MIPVNCAVKKIIFILSLITASTKMEAQETAGRAEGEYYLAGVMETASGFKLNPDSTFQFFFSYGALDRTGEGTWKLDNNHIIFNSKRGSNGFSLVNSSETGNKNITVKIVDPNPLLRSNVYVLLKAGNDLADAVRTDKNGMISFPKQQFDSIMLVLEFCPEKVFVIPKPANNHNYFEFRFEKDIMEVFFNNLSLSLGNKELSGQHPLLREGTYHFRKNGN